MIDFNQTSAVLITKGPRYPRRVLNSIARWPFNEIIIRTGCDGIYQRYWTASKAINPIIYVQDDDALCPIGKLMERADPDKVTVAMKAHYLADYSELKCCLVGWGAIFLRAKVDEFLADHEEAYGDDDLFRSQADRLFTGINYPQVRLMLPIKDTDWALLPDRMSTQPDHYELRRKALKRVEEMLG